MKTKELLLMVGKAVLKEMLNGGARDKAASDSAPVKDDLPPGIARKGEKVVAIETDLNIDEDNVMRGEILTVRDYHLGSYCFEERPAHYNPYLRDVGNPWYSASAFRAPDEISTQIIAFLDEVEANVRVCCDQKPETIKADQQKDSDFIPQLALCLKERVEQMKQENLQRLLQNCKAKENREVFSLDITQLMINQLRYKQNGEFAGEICNQYAKYILRYI